jgi:hypothetical protein
MTFKPALNFCDNPAMIEISSAPRKALVTWITGQDGSHLAELLLSRGHRALDTSRAREAFAFSAGTSFEDDLRPTITRYQNSRSIR